MAGLVGPSSVRVVTGRPRISMRYSASLEKAAGWTQLSGLSRGYHCYVAHRRLMGVISVPTIVNARPFKRDLLLMPQTGQVSANLKN